MTSNEFFLFYLNILIIFFATTVASVSAITNNSTDNSQLVQIPSYLQQPTRAFLIQQKSFLSPQQQSQILDDIQKNQKLQIQSTPSAEDRQRSLFGNQESNYYQPSSIRPIIFSQSPPSFRPHLESSDSNLRPPKFSSQYEPSLNFGPTSTESVSKKFPNNLEQLFINSQGQNGNNQFQGTGTTYPELSSRPYKSKDESSSFLKNFSPNFESVTPLTSSSGNKIVKEIYLKTNPELLIAKDRQKFFQQLLDSSGGGNKNEKTADTASDDLSNIRSEFEKELARQLQVESAGVAKININNDDLNRFLVSNGSGSGVSEITLPNGQKVQISRDYQKLAAENDLGSSGSGIKTIIVKPQTTTTGKPPEVILNELTKGVLPPGADYELIRHNKDGGLEEVDNLQNLPQKKVTFVILEEQPDGSVKVQGVRGSEKQSLKESGEEVDSIIRRIKEGQLKLPPSSKFATNPISPSPSTKISSKNSGKKHENQKIKIKNFDDSSSELIPKKTKLENKPFYPTPIVQDSNPSNPGPAYIPSSNGNYYIQDDKLLSGNYFYQNTVQPGSSSTQSSNDNFWNTEISSSSSSKNNNFETPFVPTTIPETENNDVYPSTIDPKIYLRNNIAETQIPVFSSQRIKESNHRNSQRKYFNRVPAISDINQIDNEENESILNEIPKQQQNNLTLSDILKKQGFFAMAKFLKQSGLDNILNDTGPFTLFIPSDKAFRTLLIQLGGPDRAEEKFKENPRLLSGLLLHHVIPGAFKVGNLLDEMTGVSLAGTQLRVNTYTTHDIEWNDVTVVTINGAKILDENDIVIPQGIAHAIDRVMFPLPVGNLLQSLQADRENRYSNFLKIIEESGLTPLFTGSKTFTVFAPLNRAFSESDLDKYSSDPKEAKSFVLRHIVPGALYSAGMKYYQVRDSMDDSQQITVYKEAGRIKVNSSHVITRNVPATNGVIHAIDSSL